MGGMGGMGGMAKGGGGKGTSGKGGGVRGGPEKKVKVTNLPPRAQWQELKDHMKQAGSVEFCDVVGNVGEVRYNTPDEAAYAVQLLNGSQMALGGPIYVEHWA